MNNIYSKLMKVRTEFHKLELKKTGHNKFANFKYYELADFLIPATKLLSDNGLCPMISFNNEMATMTVVNCDNSEETITFTSPMRELQLKGTNDIQNLGGIQTYLTRYLYIQLLNIVEADVFDATSGKDNKDNGENKSSQGSLTDKQINRMYAIGGKAGYDNKKVDSMIMQRYSKKAKDMTKEEYDNVVDGFEKIATNKAAN